MKVFPRTPGNFLKEGKEINPWLTPIPGSQNPNNEKGFGKPLRRPQRRKVLKPMGRPGRKITQGRKLSPQGKLIIEGRNWNP